MWMETRRVLAIAVLAASAVVSSTAPASAVVPDYWDTRGQAPE